MRLPAVDAEFSRLTHPGVVVTKGTRRCKQRWLCTLENVSSRLNIIPFGKSISNLQRGIMERLFYVDEHPPPQPTVDFNKALNHFTSLLLTHPCSPRRLTYEQFLKICPKHKVKVYEAAVQSLRIKSVNKQDSFIRAFVKVEKTVHKPTKESVPRIIQPRDPRYHVELGRYLLTYEKQLFKNIAKVFGEKTVAKGLNTIQVAKLIHQKWRSFSVPVAVGLDAKRFDQHVSVPALKWEHMIYKTHFKAESKKHLLNKLLAWQLHNKGIGTCADGSIKYSIHGSRCSGDINTSLGNSLIMCAIVHSWFETCGVKAKLINNGDDCVLFCEKNDLVPLTGGLISYFLQFGFNMEVEKPVYKMEHINFCQHNPVFDGQTYIMVRDPKIGIAKDCTSIKPNDLSPNLMKRWCASIGQGGLSLSGGIPIYQSFYKYLIDNSEGAKPIEEYTRWWCKLRPVKRHYSSITLEARISFWRAFDVSPERQEQLENLYNMLARITLESHKRYCRTRYITEFQL